MRDTENRNSPKCKTDKIRKMNEVKTTKIRKKTEKVRNEDIDFCHCIDSQKYTMSLSLIFTEIQDKNPLRNIY